MGNVGQRGLGLSNLGNTFSDPRLNPAAQPSAPVDYRSWNPDPNFFGGAGVQQNVAPYITSQSSSSSSSGANLSPLIQQIQNMNPTSTQTTTTNQNRSPEFEAQMQQWANMLNSQNQNTTQASQNLANTFADAMNALSQMYGKQSTAAQQGAASGALATGLTPLEASGAAQTAGQNALTNFFPQLAALQQGQGQVEVDLQNTLAGLQQSLGLPALGMANTYNQAVAGQTQNTTTTDPMAKMNLLANMTAEQQKLAQAQSSQSQNDALGWAKLQADRQYQQGQLANQMKELMQSGQFNQGQLTNQARGQDVAAQTALQDLMGRQGMANQTANVTARGQDVMAQGQQLTAQAEQQRLQQALMAMLFGQSNTDRTYKTDLEQWQAEKMGTGPLVPPARKSSAMDKYNNNGGGDNPYLTSFFNNMAK